MTIYIELLYKSEKINGQLIKEDKTNMTIKLESGYNCILAKKEIKIISKKENKLIRKEELKPKKINKSLPNILILHTGGTIASKIDYRTGAVSSKFTPEEILNLYPELNKLANLNAKLIGNLFSEDMRFSHYNLLLNEIKLVITSKKIDGIIISHGTDTLHYTSSALQYSLKNLPIPVILVGAQRSSDRPSSDAYLNLKASINFIIKNKNKDLNFRRVGICMHENISDDSFLILDGINVKKMHSTRRDAFKQINYLPYARLNNEDLTILRKELNSKKPKEKISFTKFNEELKIGFFKAHPNLFPEEIKQLDFYDGVILEGTGLGHMAVSVIDKKTELHKNNLIELGLLSKKIPVIIGTQTIYGETNLDIYSSGKDIQGEEIYGNHMNLITETLFTRLAYCISLNKKSFKEIWDENLEGFNIRSIDIEYNNQN